MRRRRVFGWVVLIAALTLVAAACAKEEGGGTGGGTGSAPQTLLDRIMADGVLRVSTDPAYPPQSYYDEATGTWEGFDIDVATEIAKRMGVEISWETPNWDVITAGNWNDRWDLSVGSMTITAERAQVLDFSVPYYFTPAGLAVQQGSPITSIDQLSGKSVGVAGATTYEFYLERKLNIPGYPVTYVVPEDVRIVTYDTDSTAIQDLVIGRLDAVMSAVPTLQTASDKGKPIQLLGDPVFYEPLGAAADRNAPLDPTSFIQKVSDIITQMHEDGTLTQLSMKWYKTDLTQNLLASSPSASPTA